MSVFMQVQLQRLAFFGSVVAALAGCGSAPAAPPEPDAFPFVQCKVVMGGKDVAGAIVTFHGEGAQDQKIVSAYDSDNDCYRFTTSVDGEKKAGVPEGEYKVTVKPGRGTKAKIPGKYTDPKSSGLTAKVAKGTNFLPPFELTP
jgi:hypothetical protein